ncbi:MAG: hypothetical protein JO080_02230 [Mucilaginibacter sp.]|nr:hypothetical protein [Mucilaginibacter sp.]
MGLFYKAPRKRIFEQRNEIFIKYGVPALKKNGFEESPYKGMRFGKLDAGTYAFDLCRLTEGSHLETITTYISKGDRWIKIYLNIFILKPTLKTLSQLNGLDQMQFFLPPNSISEMRLRSDDFKGMPLFNTVKYKIKRYYSERGFQKRLKRLGELIERDLNNIDRFKERWYELHEPLMTDWEGHKLD